MAYGDIRIVLGGVAVDLRERDEAITYVSERAGTPHNVPLVVASINLDHIHHFGTGSRWHGMLDDAIRPAAAGQTAPLEWFNLVDGAPIASQARRLTGRPWPRLAGSDLIGPLLERAERAGTRVGFLGGLASTHDLLSTELASRYPNLVVSGYWAPDRDELSNHERSTQIALEIAHADTDLLVVGLGKPRQELWIAEHGRTTGARVFLAFGAAADLLAGRVTRAPQWVADQGAEWMWRLALEPRRLASRYLIEGPPAYLAIRRSQSRHPVTSMYSSGGTEGLLTENTIHTATDTIREPRMQYPLGTIIIPAHNEETVIARTLTALAPLAESNIAEVLVVCNGCTDETARIAAGFPGVVVHEIDIPSKTAAMNAGDTVARFWPRLYLDADIEAPPEAVTAVFHALAAGPPLAARPAFQYDTVGAAPLVRSYYRARDRIPSTHGSLWGAGAFALTEKGHQRFLTFPALFADDLYIDSLFLPREKRVLRTPPVLVRTPLTLSALLSVLTRQSRSNVQSPTESTLGTSIKGLLSTTRTPQAVFDTAVYVVLTALGRVRSKRQLQRGSPLHWERDLSSRVAGDGHLTGISDGTGQ